MASSISEDPAWFEPIVPPILEDPRFWVLVSGGFEIVLGLGMAIPAWREPASFGMTVLMVALYWANLHMWVNDVPLNGRTYATIWHVLWLRRPSSPSASGWVDAGTAHRRDPDGDCTICVSKIVTTICRRFLSGPELGSPSPLSTTLHPDGPVGPVDRITVHLDVDEGVVPSR